jgi:hypothetical protein
MRQRLDDYLMALWAGLVGVAFVSLPFAGMWSMVQAASRYVYAVVLAACLAGLALRAMRRLRVDRRTGS